MKTTDFRPVFMGPVDLLDPDALRAAISELETALHALHKVPITLETLQRAAKRLGFTKAQGRTGYYFLVKAIQLHWLKIHPGIPDEKIDWIEFGNAFSADRRARGLSDYSFSELRMYAVHAVLSKKENLRAHHIKRFLLQFLAENGLTD